MRGDGRIYKRGRVYWIAYYHHGREVRESAQTEDAKIARRKLRERMRTAGTADFIGPREERVRFDDLAELYLTDYRINGRRSIDDAERLVQQLKTFFGGDRALAIPDRISAYVDIRLNSRNRKGDLIASATVNRELSALRRMFHLAIIHKMLKVRPHIPMLEEGNIREGFFEAADFEAVSVHLPPEVADVARFGFLTGWRKGEILTLEWRDVDLQEGTIRLRRLNSKTKKGRILVLRGELLDLVRHRAALRRLDCPYVFHRDGKQIRSFRKAWSAACHQAGLDGRLFHDLRRSAVRNMIRAGVAQNVAMRISGHKTDSVFRRYDIVNENDVAEALALTQEYVERKRREAPRVTPLHAATRKK